MIIKILLDLLPNKKWVSLTHLSNLLILNNSNISISWMKLRYKLSSISSKTLKSTNNMNQQKKAQIINPKTHSYQTKNLKKWLKRKRVNHLHLLPVNPRRNNSNPLHKKLSHLTQNLKVSLLQAKNRNYLDQSSKKYWLNSKYLIKSHSPNSNLS